MHTYSYHKLGIELQSFGIRNHLGLVQVLLFGHPSMDNMSQFETGVNTEQKQLTGALRLPERENTSNTDYSATKYLYFDNKNRFT